MPQRRKKAQQGGFDPLTMSLAAVAGAKAINAVLKQVKPVSAGRAIANIISPERTTQFRAKHPRWARTTDYLVQQGYGQNGGFKPVSNARAIANIVAPGKRAQYRKKHPKWSRDTDMLIQAGYGLSSQKPRRRAPKSSIKF